MREEALQAVRRIGSGGHYLGDEFTLEHFRDASISPHILDYQSFEQWRAAGSKDMPQRANEKARKLLIEFQSPPLDPTIHEALDAYVTTRQEQISPNFS